MKETKNRLIFGGIITAALLAGNPVCAQEKNVDYFRKKYPDIGEVILNQNETMNISVKDGILDISSDTYEESYIIDSDVMKRSSVGDVPYSSFQQVKNIEAYTLVPNGNKFKKIEITSFKDVPNRSNRTFHDDFKSKQFDYPNLNLGAKKTLKYTTTFPEPRILKSQFFIDRFPVESKKFTVIADKNVDVGYKVFNNEKNKIHFSKEEKNGKTIYQWEANDIPKYSYEEKMPNTTYYTPLVEVYVKSFTGNDGQKKIILNSLDDLHNLYASYIKGIEEKPSEALTQTALSLKAKHTDELDQVKEIYYWVKDNIKYIAFEDGYGGFIPRKANDVYEKRYGDCKDMSSIIYSMLKAAGIQNIYFTWIGSRDKPFTYEELPTQLVDDHMIATYQHNGKNYFLDGTSRNTAFGLPSFFIQGKQALLHKEEGKYELVNVPVISADQSARKDTVQLTYDNGKLLGKAETSYTGYKRDEFLEMIQDLSGFQRTQFLKEALELGNNKFILENPKISNQENRDLPLNIDYSFTLDNYAVAAGDDIYINLSLNLMEDIMKTLKTDRQYDYENNFAQAYISTVTFTVPEGYKVVSVPKNSGYQSEEFSCSINYRQEKNQIIADTDVKINYLLLKKENITKWNSFVNAFKESAGEAIEITKKQN